MKEMRTVPPSARACEMPAASMAASMTMMVRNLDKRDPQVARMSVATCGTKDKSKIPDFASLIRATLAQVVDARDFRREDGASRFLSGHDGGKGYEHPVVLPHVSHFMQ